MTNNTPDTLEIGRLQSIIAQQREALQEVGRMADRFEEQYDIRDFIIEKLEALAVAPQECSGWRG